MTKVKNGPLVLNSVSEMHRMLGLSGPEHPLVSTIYFNDIKDIHGEIPNGLVLNFYMIAIKKDYKGKIRYGQSSYDFDEGMMSFIAPGQICYENEPGENPLAGCMLLIHPDFLGGYALAKNIRNYEFFSYAVNEGLYLSQKEETMVEGIMRNIEQEYKSAIDTFSQDVIISHIELLLTYSNRFYNRQFLTRKSVNNDLVAKMESLLTEHYNSDKTCLPRVKDIADRLNVSPGYLSDMLRALTGQNAQQHIHNKLIDKAKEVLTTTPLSVSEIAYQLGFEYPQSFSKLFKTKTNVSPLEYRKLFN
ncbi:AraC family transcriptional regulator [Flavobacterium sp. DG1-102-2]|uniref:helix-turn-helix domain-containing protein n=1 Tax=Flavobacterium sp. DG1-102-2 TaxID=3081663 RepID=UPI00294A52E7|nr:AraC family transcriptional regulator [Flavobacterium sp. DG1-102-2]MDV6168293.1 AraC family transcriptional regulator [Flavobacterium sp. DG1-102-2]